MNIIRMTKIQCISIYAQAQVKLSNSGGNQFYKPIWHIWPHIALWWTNHHFDALHEIVIILILHSDNSSSRLNSAHRDYTYIVLDIHNISEALILTKTRLRLTGLTRPRSGYFYHHPLYGSISLLASRLWDSRSLCYGPYKGYCTVHSSVGLCRASRQHTIGTDYFTHHRVQSSSWNSWSLDFIFFLIFKR